MKWPWQPEPRAPWPEPEPARDEAPEGSITLDPQVVRMLDTMARQAQEDMQRMLDEPAADREAGQ